MDPKFLTLSFLTQLNVRSYSFHLTPDAATRRLKLT